MKTYRIEAKNAAAIESALRQVNGRAEQHAYTTFGEIERLAAVAEERLLELVYKKDAPGAAYRKTSGGRVPSSYIGVRLGTSVRLERKTAGWYLTAVSQATLHRNGGGDGVLILTQAQDAAAVALFRKRYRVA